LVIRGLRQQIIKVFIENKILHSQMESECIGTIGTTCKLLCTISTQNLSMDEKSIEPLSVIFFVYVLKFTIQIGANKYQKGIGCLTVNSNRYK